MGMVTEAEAVSEEASMWQRPSKIPPGSMTMRSEEHTSELQSRLHLVCRLLLEKKKEPALDGVREFDRAGLQARLGRPVALGDLLAAMRAVAAIAGAAYPGMLRPPELRCAPTYG